MYTSKKDVSARVAAGAEPAFVVADREDILNCITAYYNDTSIDISDAKHRLTSIAADVGGLDYSSFNNLERLALVLRLESGDYGVGTVSTRNRELSIRMIAGELRKHRAEFCAAVKWLCTEKPEPEGITWLDEKLICHPVTDHAKKSIKYFQEHGLQHIKLHVMMPDGMRLFSHANCTHWVDLFCIFLLRECSGRFPHQMPIKLCRYCGKLFSTTRSDTEFCPGRGCQRKNFWTEARHNDYEFVRRHMKFAENCLSPQSGYSLEDLRTKLDKPRVKQRLQAIQQRWSDWQKILEMIKTIGETAQVSKGSTYEATRRV